MHISEVRPRRDHRSVDLISGVVAFGTVSQASATKFRSRSHDAVIRVYDESGNVIQTHEHAGDFKEW
jgi:hypothetical protein